MEPRFKETKDALVTFLADNIDDVGTIDIQQGRQAGFPWEDVTAKKMLPFWQVELHRAQISEVVIGAQIWKYTYLITLYYPVNFEANSVNTFMDYLTTAVRVLNEPNALTHIICVTLEPPSVNTVSYTMLLSREKDIVCHYAEIEVTAKDYITKE